MISWKTCIRLCVLSGLVLDVAARALRRATGGKAAQLVQSYKRAPLQEVVTWDEHSLFVNGERIMFYSGEFHPYRLPSQGLYLDVFQKIKAMGYNGVSFYTHWSLLEGEEGYFRDTGIFDLDPFFHAASEAGIYLLARPGPYINGESSGGGFPGWMQRLQGYLRSSDPAYMNATQLYLKSMGQILAKAQITNGGPVILVQIENEYDLGFDNVTVPDRVYLSNIEDNYRDAGVLVPFTNNDAWNQGIDVPGSGPGAPDIYGFDSYPIGFNCFAPYAWTASEIASYFYESHLQQSPSTPFDLPEFQGGSIDGWGGAGYDACDALTGPEFERVFYKNNFAQAATMMSLYMTYGGTNWGNLGYPGVYTSYDYGSAITEDRLVTRQKYSEAKLIAQFIMSSPDYLTAIPDYVTDTEYANTAAISVTASHAANNRTNFYVVRHTNVSTLTSTPYHLILPTSKGKLNIPQITGHLTLMGRDSKMLVTDYDVNGHNLLYATADIFTWRNSSSKTVLVLYGEVGERHELAFTGTPAVEVMEGSVDAKDIHGSTVLNFMISSTRQVLRVGSNGPFVYMMSRASAYNWWTLPISGSSTSLVANGGYLLRNASISGETLSIIGDLNNTSPLEIVLGAPTTLSKLTFNGKKVDFQQDKFGTVTATLAYTIPDITFPTLADLDWKYHDSFPEIQPAYDDAAWTSASLKKTYNIDYNLSTPTSLFSGDYGYNTGNLIFRGHFSANGSEKTLALTTQGGTAYGTSVYLNSTFLGSWVGSGADGGWQNQFSLPTLTKGSSYVLTVVIDNMGYDENWDAGDSGMKDPRGIMDFSLSGRDQSAITWKITGNLGGEHYADKARGPYNEGGFYAERQGWHLPKPPTSSWVSSSPFVGMTTPGIGFYSTSFKLDVPVGYDTPLSFIFAQEASSATSGNWRVQLYVNGYQFGKYVNNIGPQTSFPVPEGILDHHGVNYVGLTLWALDASGASLPGLILKPTAIIQSGYGAVTLAPRPAYSKRANAY